MKQNIYLRAVLLLVLFRSMISSASEPSLTPGASEEVINLRPYTVTGGFSQGDPDATILPVSSLYGGALQEMRGLTLGATLELMLGVQSTAFAGGASRPIIRGFDGARIQILQEGLAVADVSADSPDHAVEITPDFAGRIDVIRGPATLLYGGNAIGGVVNVVGGVFPQLSQRNLVLSQVGLQYHSVSRGWGQRLETNAWGENWAAFAAASKSEYSDYKIPGYASSGAEMRKHHDHEEEPEAMETERLGQSFSDSLQYAAGIRHRFSSHWEWAAGVGQIEKIYGVPGHAHPVHDEASMHEDHEEAEHAHEGVAIDMDHRRYDLELLGSWNQGWLHGLKLRIHGSDYRHVELEGAEVGTSFDKGLLSARLELLNQTDVGLSGVSGFHWDRVDYASDGEEALIPDLESETLSAFAVQSYESGAFRMHGGVRWELINHTPRDSQPAYSEAAISSSGGITWQLSVAHQLDLVLSNAARHPSSTELYADGLHAATSSYETGNSRARKEVSKGIDLRYSWEHEQWHAVVSAYCNRFKGYLNANPSGGLKAGFPVFVYQQNDADFWGMEVELSREILRTDSQRLEISLMTDFVKSNLLDSGAILPRSPAQRLGMTLRYARNNWTLRSDYRHYFAVNEVSMNELPTDAYHVWNVSIIYPITVGATQLFCDLKFRNLLDEEIRPHTSFLKDLAPQPGRGVVVGLRYEF